jgi:site-specific recombinase XerD
VQGRLGSEPIRETLDTRNWERASALVHQWDAQGKRSIGEPQLITVETVCDEFLRDAAARELRESTLKKYRQLIGQMKAFAKASGLPHLEEWDLDALRKFRSSWRDNGISALKKLERLRALFRFAHESGWIVENQARKVKNPTREALADDAVHA